MFSLYLSINNIFFGETEQKSFQNIKLKESIEAVDWIYAQINAFEKLYNFVVYTSYIF